jgi:hypothetical protein
MVKMDKLVQKFVTLFLNEIKKMIKQITSLKEL